MKFVSVAFAATGMIFAIFSLVKTLNSKKGEIGKYSKQNNEICIDEARSKVKLVNNCRKIHYVISELIDDKIDFSMNPEPEEYNG